MKFNACRVLFFFLCVDFALLVFYGYHVTHDARPRIANLDGEENLERFDKRLNRQDSPEV